MSAASRCPDDVTLTHLLQGRLEHRQMDDIGSHLLACDVCAARAGKLDVADALTVSLRDSETLVSQPADPRLRQLQALLHELRREQTSPGEGPTESMVPATQVSATGSTPSPADAAFEILAPPQAPDEIGRLGPYRILKVLGKGGMGVVFQAEDPRLGRMCALKAMLPHVADSPEMKERFLREARAAAHIEHDHIVPVYQVDEDRGVPYIAMPFLQGSSLEDWLRASSRRESADSMPGVPVAEILRIGRQIATGLAAAHERGLIHRDIKPGNIWLDSTAGNRVKILDFGLARVAEAADQQQLTQSGSIMGTPSYMAPEQAKGHHVDGRADLFSLGVILYRLCTGVLPFKGSDTMCTLLLLATHEPPPPRAVNPAIPRPLSTFVMKLLEKEPTNRTPSAVEAIKALQLLEQSLQPQPADRRPLRGQLIAAASAAALVLLGLWVYIKNDKGETVAKVGVPERGSVTVTSDEPPPPTVDLNLPALLPVKGMNSTGPQPPLAIAPFDAAQARAHQEAWANHLGTTVETTNSVGAKMILIPPGEFLMGSSDEQVAAALKVANEVKSDRSTKDRIQKAERPQHRVVLTRPLLMGATEVTVGQFKQFIDASKYVTNAERQAGRKVVDDKVNESDRGKTWQAPGYSVTDDLPVTQISWHDAAAYCLWLSGHEKAIYRLPTEAEWEYACRAGTTTQYSFGDDFKLLGQSGWYGFNSDGKVQPVGTKPANAFGLHDMHGNLWEMCQDFYDEKWYEKSPSSNPNGPASGAARVVRGGDWGYIASICRSTSRYYGTPPSFSNFFGFRCVRVPELPPAAATAVVHPVPPPVSPSTDAPAWRPTSEERLFLVDVAKLPVDEQVATVLKKLSKINPGFNGKLTSKNDEGKVVEVSLEINDVTNPWPIRALTDVKIFSCNGGDRRGKLKLAPLAGMPLTRLVLSSTSIPDLSPLVGMPLMTLDLFDVEIADLSPLAGMPLRKLSCYGTSVANISVLAGLPLEELTVSVPLFHEPDEMIIRNLPKLSRLDLNAQGLQPSQKAWQGQEARRLAAEAFAKATAKLSPDEQIMALTAKLRELNAGAEIGLGPVVRNGTIVDVTLTLPVSAEDVSPLRALVGLNTLTIIGGPHWLDLSPLNSTPLDKLTCREPIAQRNAHILKAMPTLRKIVARPDAAK